MTELIFNDVSNIDIGILLKNEKIDIPAPERDISEITIPGRDGVLHKDNKRYMPISFDAGFNFKDLENTEEVFRKVKKWLRGSGELSLSYDIDYFYKVTNIKLNSYKHTHTRVAEFSATFTAEPFQYLKVGKAPILNPNELYNSGYESKPIYKITGEGLCGLIVNGNSIKVNVGQNVIIDTERLLCYKQNGQNVNTSVTGDISKLTLKEGSNSIYWKKDFELEVIPNWRCI